jgi:hypothetical protein
VGQECVPLWSETETGANKFDIFLTNIEINKYFKHKSWMFSVKTIFRISNKAVYNVRKLLEGNCPKKIPKKLFFHVKHPTVTNTYIYIRLLRCKTN